MFSWNEFLGALANVLYAMSPYMLFGFLVAGLLHAYVPPMLFRRYLSGKGFRPLLYAVMLGIPLPLCSCGTIPTAIGLRREGASRGAVASFLIATPQTGIDSIMATFSIMGLGFAIVRPVAALVTGLCGGWLVSRLANKAHATGQTAVVPGQGTSHGLAGALRYAFVDIMGDIGMNLFIGLLLAAIIQVALPDSFFTYFSASPIMQMLAMMIVAVPMYVCSTGSIPIAASLLAKGMSPGAALVLLMAGPAINMASILVVRKTLGSRFCAIYLFTIVAGAMLFGLALNHLVGMGHLHLDTTWHACGRHASSPTPLQVTCSLFLAAIWMYSIVRKMRLRHKASPIHAGTTVYRVEGMYCSHCKAAVEQAVAKVEGVMGVEAHLEQHTLSVRGNVSCQAVEQAVEQAGFKFQGKES